MGGLGFNGDARISELMSVERWGNVAFTTMNQAFFNATNDRFNATDTPDLRNVTNMESTFRNATSLGNVNLSNWNTSNVTSMHAIFMDNTTFSGDISGWNTANVTRLDHAFQNTNAFNSDINGWNVGNVTNLVNTFWDADGFNRNHQQLEHQQCDNMQAMFGNADRLNGNITSWNTGAVTDMSQMFRTRCNSSKISGPGILEQHQSLRERSRCRRVQPIAYNLGHVQGNESPTHVLVRQ